MQPGSGHVSGRAAQSTQQGAPACTAQHSTAWYGTSQHSTAQHGTRHIRMLGWVSANAIHFPLPGRHCMEVHAANRHQQTSSEGVKDTPHKTK
jgi:hypothetical protein